MPALVDVLEAISIASPVDVLTARVAPLVARLTAADACLVFVRDESDGSIALSGATPPFDRDVGRVSLPHGDGPAGWVARHDGTAIVARCEAGARDGSLPGLDVDGYMSFASVPMASSPGGLAGVLRVYARARREFTEQDVRLLTSIGGLIAGAIHQNVLHGRLAASDRAHERFTEQAIAAQEAERRRLAADIHDGITQRLCSLRFHLDAAADALTAEPSFAAEQLLVARTLARLTLDEARVAINGLRPPVLDDLDLADSLASLARPARTIAGVEVLVDVDECVLPGHVEVALYRIAQEALQNVVKHASASTVRLQLRRTGDSVVLEVADDGRGWDREGGARSGAAADPMRADDPARGGYGLQGMAERAELIGGGLTVTSRPGRGTTVTATVPLT
ncbi:MAG: ATP-binding protein [Actinopolymorphaceae bacterium]